jgi:hypothetical protein
MSITHGYCNLSEFKGYYGSAAGITSSSGVDDMVIEDLIEAASRFIDNESGKRFWLDSADATRYFTASDDDRLYINPGASSITSVACDYEGDGTYDVVWATTDYATLPANAAADGLPYNYLMVKGAGRYTFPVGIINGVQVVGKWGFPSVPADIQRACLEIAANAYRARAGDAGDASATVTAAGVVLRPNAVPASAWRTIKQYRRLI